MMNKLVIDYNESNSYRSEETGLKLIELCNEYNRIKIIQKRFNKLSYSKKDFYSLRLTVNKIKGIHSENTINSALNNIFKPFQDNMTVHHKNKVSNYCLQKHGKKAIKDYHNGNRVDNITYFDKNGYRLVLLSEYKFFKGDYVVKEKQVKKDIDSKFSKIRNDPILTSITIDKTIILKVIITSYEDMYDSKALERLNNNYFTIFTDTHFKPTDFLGFNKTQYGKIIKSLLPLKIIVKDFIINPDMFYDTYKDKPYITRSSKILSMYTQSILIDNSTNLYGNGSTITNNNSTLTDNTTTVYGKDTILEDTNTILSTNNAIGDNNECGLLNIHGTTYT